MQVLDFPDNQEEVSRNILSKQDDKTLVELATKSKDEILTFLYQEKMKSVKEKEKIITEEKTQITNTNIEIDKKNNSLTETYQENNQKFQDIKNILPN